MLRDRHLESDDSCIQNGLKYYLYVEVFFVFFAVKIKKMKKKFIYIYIKWFILFTISKSQRESMMLKFLQKADFKYEHS